MISFLEGILVAFDAENLILEVGGIGWQLQASRHTIEKLPRVGEKVKIHTFLLVREDALVLYGFHSPDERDLFLELRSVSGIGPKVALNILSAVPEQTLRGAIANGDLALLTKIPGVGKKTAQRIALELHGKLVQNNTEIGSPPSGTRAADVLEALLNLGYSRPEAFAAVEQAAACGETDTSAMVKKALQVLSGGRR